MSQVKLFSSTGARVARRSGKPKKQKVKKPLKTLAIWLLVILCLEGLYFFCIYTNNSFVKKWRTIYINTAMDTMRHQWLATYFIPKDVIDEVRYEYGLVKAGTVGKESTWGRTDPVPADQTPSTSNDNIVTLDPNVTHETDQPDSEELTQEELEKQAEENFYSVFWELDRTSMETYLAEHPDTLANGWEHIYINEAGFDDEGTSIQSTFGEQVLVSFFSSVTPRTAGYNSVDTAALSPGSKLLTIILMFIGASPGSTAGGVKTTTIAVLVACLIAGVRGKRDPEIFGRRISSDNMRQAGVMVFMNLSLALTGALLICLVQDFELTDVLFEVFSAMGTVGMTTGITRDLCDFSAVIIVLLMYLGRVGSLSFAMALLERRAHARVRCPEESVTIG